IRDCSRRGGLVLDPFAGSGTVVIAAERTGRKARIIEIDPGYCDLIVKRWQDYTGKRATHDRSGAEFDDLESQIRAHKGDSNAKNKRRQKPEEDGRRRWGKADRSRGLYRRRWRLRRRAGWLCPPTDRLTLQAWEIGKPARAPAE